MNVLIRKENSPHLRRKDSLFRMLLDVLIALSPVSIMAIVAYTYRAVIILAISVFTMVASEIIFVLIKNKIPYDGTKHTFKEHLQKGFKAVNINNILAPIISGVIFALIMPAHSNPASIIYVATFVGALVGIVLGKLVFGGTGQNIFNPAAVGMVFAKICFGSRYTYEGSYYVTSVFTSGTPLSTAMEVTNPNLPDYLAHYANLNDFSIFDFFFGKIPGAMGEAFKFAILIGLVYLLIRRAADWRVMLSYFGTFLLLMGVAGIFVVTRGVANTSWHMFMLYQLLTGGVLFGGVYMVTDPVTMPINSPSRFLYGTIVASLTVFIRLFGAYPEGVAFSILLGNLLAPVLDYHAWSSQQFTMKKIILQIGVLLLGIGIIAICFGLGGKA